MDDYRKAVEYYASNHLNYLFHNKGPEHAKIIFENIFKVANEHIRIAANNLWNTEVVNTQEYIDALRTFLDKPNSKLDIILTNEPNWNEVKADEANNIYKLLLNYKSKVRIKTGEGKNFRKTDTNQIVHLCTADDSIYRLEDNIDERTAICNFKDEKTVSELNKIFDGVFNSGIKVVDLAVCLA